MATTLPQYQFTDILSLAETMPSLSSAVAAHSSVNTSTSTGAIANGPGYEICGFLENGLRARSQKDQIAERHKKATAPLFACTPVPKRRRHVEPGACSQSTEAEGRFPSTVWCSKPIHNPSLDESIAQIDQYG